MFVISSLWVRSLVTLQLDLATTLGSLVDTANSKTNGARASQLTRLPTAARVASCFALRFCSRQITVFFVPGYVD